MRAKSWISERDLAVEAKLRLFCLPHAGSGAAAFYRWKRELREVAVCPVLLPGREMRIAEKAMDDSNAVVDALLQALREHLDVSYAIFGHSMGALLAFELARRIEAEGIASPVALILSGRNAACLPIAHRELHRLSDDALVEALRIRYGEMNDKVLDEAEMRSIFLPVLRADLKLVETYRSAFGAKLRCPVLAIAGKEDGSVSDEGLARWKELTEGEFGWRRVAGGHFYHVGEGREELLEILRRLAPPPWGLGVLSVLE